jgi:hypothetical protein
MESVGVAVLGLVDGKFRPSLYTALLDKSIVVPSRLSAGIDTPCVLRRWQSGYDAVGAMESVGVAVLGLVDG